MKLSAPQNRIISLLFLVGYFLVAFVVQHLHNHKEYSNHQESEFKTVEIAASDTTDCLACHLLHDSHYTFDSSSVCSLNDLSVPHQPLVTKEITISLISSCGFSLRAPPSVV